MFQTKGSFTNIGGNLYKINEDLDTVKSNSTLEQIDATLLSQDISQTIAPLKTMEIGFGKPIEKHEILNKINMTQEKNT